MIEEKLKEENEFIFENDIINDSWRYCRRDFLDLRQLIVGKMRLQLLGM